MPYMRIYRLLDGLYHVHDCTRAGFAECGAECTLETSTHSFRIGSIQDEPDPPKAQMCRKCFPSLPALKTAKDYYTSLGEEFMPFSHRGYTSVEVLPFLTGRPWDDLALAYVHALRPSTIRVTTGGCKANAQTWRVTVFIDTLKSNLIRSIEQEVQVGLPDGVRNGHALDLALKYGVDSPQVKEWSR